MNQSTLQRVLACVVFFCLQLASLNALPLDVLEATYRVVNVDVTHKAPIRPGPLDKEPRHTFSSYSVAIIDVYFNQPLFYRGLSILDVADFVSKQHTHHRIFDDMVQLECRDTDVRSKSSSSSPRSRVSIIGSSPPPMSARYLMDTASSSRNSRNSSSSSNITNSNSNSTNNNINSNSNIGAGTEGKEETLLVPDVYLVPLVSARTSRFQWLRALHGEVDNVFARTHSDYVEWNRVSFALLLSSSSTAALRDVRNPMSVESEAESTVNYEQRHSQEAMERVRQMVKETELLAEQVERNGTVLSNEQMNDFAKGSAAKTTGKVEKQGRSTHVFFPATMLQRCSVDFNGGRYDMVERDEQVTQKKETGASEPKQTDARHQHQEKEGKHNSKKKNDDEEVEEFGDNVAGAHYPLTNRRGEPFTGKLPLHRSTHRSDSDNNPEEDNYHLVHQHDDELSFIAESEDVQGRSSLVASVGIPGFLMDPVVEFVGETIIPRIADFVKNKLLNKFMPQFVKSLVSEDFFFGSFIEFGEGQDEMTSPLLEIRSLAKQELQTSTAPRSFRFREALDLASAALFEKNAATFTLDLKGHKVYNSLRIQSLHLAPNGAMTKKMIEEISASITPPLSLSIANQVVEDNHFPIEEKLTRELKPYLIARLRDSVPKQVIPMVLTALKENVPKLVHEVVPEKVADAISTAVSNTITRGLVHVLAPTLAHTLRDASHIEPLCYYCYYVDPRYCYVCPQSHPVPASAQSYLDLYIIDFFVDYYTDYYADKFNGKEPLTSNNHREGSPFAKEDDQFTYQ